MALDHASPSIFDCSPFAEPQVDAVAVARCRRRGDPVAQAPPSLLAERVRRLTRDTAWRAVSSTPVGFPTHHPQGMVKIGDTLFVSSVEVKVPTRRFEKPVDGYDRDTGEGVGHLFKMTMAGALVADLPLGEGTMYHPGGIDYDGRHIWVSVAEYRPNSRSIVYRVDPETMRATEVFRYPDHIGAIVHNTDDRTLHGVSWGSRRFYRWTLDRDGRVTNAGGAAGTAAAAEPVALRGLSGLQVLGRPPDALHGRDRVAHVARRARRSGSAAST